MGLTMPLGPELIALAVLLLRFDLVHRHGHHHRSVLHKQTMKALQARGFYLAASRNSWISGGLWGWGCTVVLPDRHWGSIHLAATNIVDKAADCLRDAVGSRRVARVCEGGTA